MLIQLLIEWNEGVREREDFLRSFYFDDEPTRKNIDSENGVNGSK